MAERIKLGVSACLLGHKVRFDGGHKLDHYIVDVLGQFVDFVAVCPEFELGLGVPREALRLIGEPSTARLVTSRSGRDHTATMQAWAAKRLKELEAENARLKKLVANQALDIDMLKEIGSGNF